MQAKQFNLNDVLTFGWQVMLRNFSFFTGVGLLWVAVIYTPAIAEMVIQESGIANPILVSYIAILKIIGFGMSCLVSIGMVKIALSFCDEYRPPASTLFDAYGCFWRYVGATLLYGLIVVFGLLLLIAPGIYWGTMFAHFRYFVVEKGLGPIDALRASARTTNGVKWELFGLNLLCYFINVAGVLCLGVGALFTYPTTMIAKALVYRQLLAQTPELAWLRNGQPEPEENEPELYE